MGAYSKSTAVISIGMTFLVFTLSVQGADPYPPVPGSYRPTGEFPGQNRSPANQQFVPSRNRNPQPTYQNNPPPASYYPAPAYGSNRYSTSGYVNPGNMNNRFGSRTNDSLPYGYPADPLSRNVAPVYNPPLPAAAPGWNTYAPQATSPTYQQPAAPQYWQQQPAASQTGAYNESSPATQPSENIQTSTARPQRQAAPQAPRPFSNPQETGNAFVQRSSPSFGRNDSRFRPPELKGTP
jgi:hypothetical protein